MFIEIREKGKGKREKGKGKGEKGEGEGKNKKKKVFVGTGRDLSAKNGRDAIYRVSIYCIAENGEHHDDTFYFQHNQTRSLIH